MSTTIKSILVLIVIAAAGAALWWSGWLNNIGIPMPAAVNNATSTPQAQEQQQAVNDLPTDANDASDQALGRDTAALDVQIQSATGDLAQVDQGLNDKQTTLVNTVTTANLTSAKNSAIQEIDRRVSALQTLATRISAMTKITPELKGNINTVVQNQAQVFTQLKTEISATSSVSGVQTGVQVVKDSYRIYALIIPQAYGIAASDRVVTINNMLNGIGLKLKARIEAAQAAGADVTAVAQALTTLGTKIDSSNAHAQAAVNGTISLLPDEGDAAKVKANTDALTAGRGEIAAAHKDIADARQAIGSIMSALATLQASAGTGATQ